VLNHPAVISEPAFRVAGERFARNAVEIPAVDGCQRRCEGSLGRAPVGANGRRLTWRAGRSSSDAERAAKPRSRSSTGPAMALRSSSLRNHLLPVLGAIRLSAIRPEHMRAYAAGKRNGSAAIAHQPAGKGGRIQRVLAPKTINNHLTLLS
jgi:hypothetical protein